MDDSLRQAASDSSENRNYAENQKCRSENKMPSTDLTVFGEIRIYGDEVDAVSDGDDGMDGGNDGMDGEIGGMSDGNDGMDGGIDGMDGGNDGMSDELTVGSAHGGNGRADFAILAAGRTDLDRFWRWRVRFGSILAMTRTVRVEIWSGQNFEGEIRFLVRRGRNLVGEVKISMDEPKISKI